ncbi:MULTISPECIES: hypothetical protein [unclassified Nocardia]|uniref:hypothetical protein n=1 Tax=unclassified Nocardia TaxID=2637762 RepID=UPI001CE3FFB5|nr:MULTISPECIES: hypothetical protein [unclassified Nocardia]
MYRIIPDSVVVDQVAALPTEALLAYAEVLSVLEIEPWSGQPQHRDNPEGAVRRWVFGGSGQLVYLIADRQREVHLLRLVWLG